MGFYVHMLLCADGSIYTGHTDNIEARLAAHHDGGFRGYTLRRRPARLIFREEFRTRDEAFRAERQIKGWRREKKLALTQRNWRHIQRLSQRRQRNK